MQNNSRGLIFDTEIDPLVSASKQEWGDFTDIMRKAFEHEPLSLNRSEESILINYPMLSICLTGTHGQFRQLFTSTEDGNFSRFLHFTYFTRPSFKSSNPKKNNSYKIKENCTELANYLLDLYKKLEDRDEIYYFELTGEQWEMIDSVKKYYYDLANAEFYNQNLITSINRMNIIAVRIASIFQMLDNYENNEQRIDNKYLKAGLWIALICIASSNRLLEILPEEEFFKAINPKFRKFFEKLPQEFKREEAVEIGETIPIAVSTVGKYLTDLVKYGLLRRTDYGYYSKRTRSNHN